MIIAEAYVGEIYKIPLEVPETPCSPLGINTNISRPVAVDYDPVEGKVYCTDVTLKLVARAFPNGSSLEVIAHNNVETPDGLAVDYVGRNLYWTDQGTSKIEVARLDGSFRRSLIITSIGYPRAIILDIAERKMYWSDWGSSPKIEQANMDGSARKTIVSSGLTWVNSLAMDYQNRLLYWCDASLDKIERVDLQGNNRVLILDLSLDSMHPFGLALFGDALFWSDWHNQSVHKYNMTTSRNEVVFGGMGQPMELYIYDQARDFFGSTSCSQLNGGCSNLCLPNPQGHQCFCPEGVQLKPGDAYTCQGVNRCPQLGAPAHGSLAPCTNLPGHSCYFSCDSGYNLTGSATRTCNSHGVWTGTQPQCNAVTCPALAIPTNGIKNNCTGITIEYFDTVCQFSCHSGYTGMGSSSRRCLENGTWSGQDFNCTVITCGPLVLPTDNVVHVSPSSCLSSSLYGQTCTFNCQRPGYVLEGTSARVCGNDGQWTGSNNTSCRDIQAPSITCPPHMDNIPTEPGQSYANVKWQLPVPTDNSKEPPTLNGLRPPQKLGVGKKQITYKVTDSSGLSRSCIFFIHVKDLEPPEIANCPDGIYKTTEEKWTKIFFPGVTVTDNVGVHLFTTSRQNGSKFTWGEHNVTYTASDIAGNTAKCHFQIIIVAKPCDDLRTPQNGAKTCDKWLDGGTFCTLHCNVGYDFALKPLEIYFCDASGNWNRGDKVPDCSKSRQAETLLALAYHYLADQCTEEMHASIASNFIALYTLYLGTVGDCDGNEQCTIENVDVECGEQSGTLRRRDIADSEQASKAPLTVKFAVKVPLPRNTSMTGLNLTTQQISSNILASLNETDLTLNISGVVLEYDQSKPPVVRIVGLVCGKGQVLTGTKCVNCPLGYFFNNAGCQACAEDHYQDQEAQNECVSCPSGTSTFGQTGSKAINDCQEIPSPSRTGEQRMPAKILYPVIALGSVLVIAVIFVAIFCLRKRRLGSRQPTSNAGTQNYGTEGNVGHDNSAYVQTDNEPEYMEIDTVQRPVQQPDVGFRNPHFDPGDHYQSLDNANGRPDNVYGRINVKSKHSQSEV